MEVLEKGASYVELALVAYEVPDGWIILWANRALGYYEFNQPVDQTLTDKQWQQWQEMLEG